MHAILIFFYNGTIFFLTNLAHFGHVSAPQFFLRETVVNKKMRIIKDNFHMEYISFDWGLGSESRKIDFSDFFQAMPCNVSVYLRPSLMNKPS